MNKLSWRREILRGLPAANDIIGSIRSSMSIDAWPVEIQSLLIPDTKRKLKKRIKYIGDLDRCIHTTFKAEGEMSESLFTVVRTILFIAL